MYTYINPVHHFELNFIGRADFCTDTIYTSAVISVQVHADDK